MKNTMKCLVLAVICVLLPQLLLAENLQDLLVNQKSAEFAANYREIAGWSGCLILPEKNQRESDGSVWIQLYTCPDKDLRGKIFRVRWDFSKPENGWFKDLTVDVAIDEEAAAKSEGKHKSLLPRRLNGWQAVSPLESIAGAHMVDDIEVMLINPVRQGDSLIISDMPVQITGEEYGLVRFVGAEENGLRLVEHFDSNTRSFQPATREVVRVCMPDFPADSIPVTSTDLIENAVNNNQGWYIYGRRIDGVFQVEALEPRALLQIKPVTVISGNDEVKRFINRQNFAALTPDLSRVYHLNSGKTGISPQDAAAIWNPGEKGIVCHLFGWRKDLNRRKTIQEKGILTTGHFSFGVAEVIHEPLAGEKRWDITYQQVYAHNSNGIVSMGQKWHVYSGSLRLGRMFTIPVSDTIIKVPELDTYRFPGWTTLPLRGFMREIDVVMAMYRTGAGTGISSVRPDVSCVQDSHLALYRALRHFEENVATSGIVKRWLADKTTSPEEISRFLRLQLLVKTLYKRVSFLGLTRRDWRRAYDDILGTRKPSAIEKIINALLSKDSMFPRSANDGLLNAARQLEAPMHTIMFSQIGGNIPGLVPMAPTSPTKR